MRRRKRGLGDILVPTDGSRPARRAIREAATLACKLGARIVGLYVITPFEVFPYRKRPPAVTTMAEFERHANKTAEKGLAAVKKAAAAQGVDCRCRTVWDTSVSNGILAAARAHRCGYIVMASHGRRGLSRLLLGSATSKVLARSTIPVMVCR